MSEQSPGSISVLHVDDEPGMVETVATAVERESERIDVMSETTGADALDRLKADDVDCVVSDNQMPGMTGLEFLDAVRERYPDLPFILFTGKGSQEVASAAISAGATDYLQKGTGTSQYELLANRILQAVDTAEARAALRRECDRRADLFENAPTAMAEFTVEAGTPVVEAINSAFEETFGYDESDVVGQPVGEVLAVDERRQGHETLGDHVLAGDSVRRELECRTSDGGKDLAVSVEPFEIDGATGAYAWFDDVTGDGDREEPDGRDEPPSEYRDKANLFDQLLEQLPAAMYVKDREARHLYMSHYETDPEEVIGKTDLEIYDDEEFAHEAYEDDMQVIETGEPVINREEYNDENGEWTLTSKVPWHGEDGDVKGLIGVTRFITEKKEYERELQLKNERLEKFASVLSHDLRNPLNVAYGHLDLAQQECDGWRLDRVKTSLDRIDALIGDILELARKGQEALEPEMVELATVADRAWKNTQMGETTLWIDDDLVVRADEARTIELFENLFANAREHADPETVRVGVLAADAGFYVADDGDGISTDPGEEIFKPGFTTDEDGTGFGLAIVSEIVENHGWDITVTEGEEGGARFEITDVRTN